MSDFMQKVTDDITRRKKLRQAQSELYPLLNKFSDAALEMRGVMLSTAHKHGVDSGDLWKWLIKQVED